MRRFRDIIEDNKAPNIQNLWLNNGELKVYGNKGWTPLNATSEDRQELEEKVDSLDKEVGQIKKDLSIFGSEQGVAADGEVTKLSEFTLGEYTLSKATKTSLGGVKAITNIVNLAESATTAQVVGVVNTLLDQFRSCGLIQL